MEKECYLTPENLPGKIPAWMEELEEIRRRRAFVFDPHHAALLVLDMQEYFLFPTSHAYVPSSVAILPPIRRLIARFSSMNRPIYFTRHTASPDPADNMALWWRENPGTYDSRTRRIPEYAKSEYPTIEKHTYSAFHQTGLLERLHAHSVSQVVITGVMTHLCVETTAREAFMHNLQVFVPVDTTATYTEKMHLGSLRSLAHGFGIVCPSAELIGH